MLSLLPRVPRSEARFIPLTHSIHRCNQFSPQLPWSSGQGLTILDLDVGSCAHADDVRATSSSIDGTQTQGRMIASFCDARNLKLNANKTELVQFTYCLILWHCWSGCTYTTWSEVFRNVVALWSLSNQICGRTNRQSKTFFLCTWRLSWEA